METPPRPKQQRGSSYPASPVLISPLKQSAHSPIHDSKYHGDFVAVLSSPKLFDTQDPVRYFRDIYVLQVEPLTIAKRMEAASIQDLISCKKNISIMMKHSVRFLSESTSESTKYNIIETLIPLLRDLLLRSWPANVDAGKILTGAATDASLTDLVSGIDIILASIDSSTKLKQRALKLALVVVSSAEQGDIGAYFLRRDLFSTIVKLLSNPTAPALAYDSAVLLGLLCNYQKYNARNPYIMRITDVVDEAVMRRISQLVLEQCQLSILSYSKLFDDAQPSFVNTLKSIVSSFINLDFSFSLPGLPERSAPVCEIIVESPTPLIHADPTFLSIGAAGSSLKGSGARSILDKIAADDGSPPPSLPAKRDMNSRKLVISTATLPSTRVPTPQNPFESLPPASIVILLTFFDALNNNPAFCSTALNHEEEGHDSIASSLPSTFISLSSYILCHAAASQRASLYSRLCLIILTVLVEGADGKLTKTAVGKRPSRLCRQRLPTLPHHPSPRPLIASILDSSLIFLRHNLRKKIDIEGYVICLKLVLRSMQSLRAHAIRIEYDWVALWRSIFSLSAFLASQSDTMQQSAQINELIAQIFIVLSYASYWGDTFFRSPKDSVSLVYEILHADSILAQLSDLCGISHVTSPSSSAVTPSPVNSISSPTALTFHSSPPATNRTSRSTQQGGGSTSSVFKATEDITNIRLIISFFKAKVASAATSAREARGAAVLVGGGDEEDEEIEDVRAVILASLGSLELLESSRMGEEADRYSEKDDHIPFFGALMKQVYADVLEMI